MSQKRANMKSLDCQQICYDICTTIGAPIYIPKGPYNGEPSILYSVHLLLV